MKKFIFLISLLLSMSIFAHENHNDTMNVNTVNTADVALKNILSHSIKVIVDAKKTNNKLNKNDIKQLITANLLPFIDTTFSAKQTLKEHWDTLTNKQKTNLEQYIINSIIRDYASILINFNDFDKINIEVDKNIKTQGNKAIVAIKFKSEEQNNPLLIAGKMIQTDMWRIYDVVFSGVSLMKNYKSQFNSYIKRKGFDKFAQKYLNN